MDKIPQPKPHGHCNLPLHLQEHQPPGNQGLPSSLGTRWRISHILFSSIPKSREQCYVVSNQYLVSKQKKGQRGPSPTYMQPELQGAQHLVKGGQVHPRRTDPKVVPFNQAPLKYNLFKGLKSKYFSIFCFSSRKLVSSAHFFSANDLQHQPYNFPSCIQKLLPQIVDFLSPLGGMQMNYRAIFASRGIQNAMLARS